MPLSDFDQLYQRADRLAEPVPVAVAGAEDRTVLEALRIAANRGWVAPFLVGRAAEIRRLARPGELSQFEIVDSDDLAVTAVNLIRTGEARLLMKGQVSTPEFMKPVLDQQHGIRTARVISQVVLMEIVPARRRFLLSDTGICVQPSLEQKIDILRSAVGVAHAAGARVPRVALLAATESVTEKMCETIDARRIEELSRAGAFPDCEVAGPLSFDMAYSPDAAHKKHSDSSVAGNADVMIFPNLVSANLAVKAIMYTADCRFGGVLCGASCPVVFMSRADTTATRLNSLALALALGTGEGSRAAQDAD